MPGQGHPVCVGHRPDPPRLGQTAALDYTGLQNLAAGRCGLLSAGTAGRLRREWLA